MSSSRSSKSSHFLFAAGILALAVGMTACGMGEKKSTSSTAGQEAGTVYAGGTLVGATVCIDNNADLVCDSAATTTTTDSNGKFTLPAGGTILVRGGYDTDSLVAGKTMANWTADKVAANAKIYFNPYVGALSAPSGSNAVTPITTMVQTLVNEGKSVTDAQSSIQKSMGIDATVSLVGASAANSLTNASAMVGIQALGRMFRQAATSIAAASGIDTTSTNVDKLPDASKADLAKIFMQVSKSAATSFSANVAAASPTVYNFVGSTAANTTDLGTLVTNVIKTAVSNVTKDATFTSATSLNQVNPAGIAALAGDTIVQGVQNVAKLVSTAGAGFATSSTLDDVVSRLQAQGMNLLIGAQERLDIVADRMRDPLFKAMITNDNLKNGTATTLDSTIEAKIKAIGTELAGVQTVLKDNSGKLEDNSVTAGVMKAMTGALMQVATVAADPAFNSAKLAPSIEIPNATNISKKMVQFVADSQKIFYGATVSADQTYTLTTVMMAGMQDKMKEVKADVAKNAAAAFKITDDIIANTLSFVLGEIQSNTGMKGVFDSTKLGNMGALVQKGIVDQYSGDTTKLGTLLANNPEIAKNIKNITGKDVSASSIVEGAAKAPEVVLISSGKNGFMLVNNTITINSVPATVASNGSFTVSSFVPSTAVWGGVSTLSFVAKAQGAPFGGISSKVAKIGFSVTPVDANGVASTKNKMRMSMLIDKVNFVITGGTLLTADIPVGATLSYAFTNETGSQLTASLVNTKADIITISSDHIGSTGATITLNGNSLINPIASNVTAQSAYMKDFPMLSKGRFVVTTFMEGVNLMDKGANSFDTGTLLVNGVSLTGSKLTGTLIVQ
ncbi:MAG: hypothetical protein H7833_17135 [Magnetococcus sp. DMHC-1]|nr:hypothetical protein [Magnetococcales bacterium]